MLYFGIGLFICALIVIIYLVCKAKGNRKVDNIWEERRNKIEKNTDIFNCELQQVGFNADLKVSVMAYCHSDTKRDIFRLYIDKQAKKIAVASFEENFKVEFVDFAELQSFSILDGVTNTTMQSFTTGSSIGYGVRGGIASTNSYQETTIGGIKLKLDFKDTFKAPLIVMIHKYNLDQASEGYGELMNVIENIKSILSKIIQTSNQAHTD